MTAEAAGHLLASEASDMFGPHELQPGDLPRRSCVSPVGVVRSAAMLTTAAFGAGSSGRFGATGSGLRMSLMGRPLPTVYVSYPGVPRIASGRSSEPACGHDREDGRRR